MRNRAPTIVVLASILMTGAAGYLTNVVTANPPNWVKNWGWPLYGTALTVQIAVAVWQASTAKAKSPDRRVVARRQAVTRILAANEAVLERTFAAVPRLALELRSRPELARPGAAEIDPTSHTDLKAVFDQTARALLLLGAGGSGKTMLMTDLCVRLCREELARDSPDVPVLITSATWTGGKVDRWLPDAIIDACPGVTLATAKQWVEDRTLVLLLDSLDELGDRRGRFLESLGEFLSDATCPVVLCCRTEDFAELRPPKSFSYALEVRKPDREQVVHYLTELHSPAADAVAAVSERDGGWWSMVREPLMVGVIAQIAAERPSADLVSIGPSRNRRRHILGVYVDTLLNRRDSPWDAKEARRWLAWLAKWMSEQSATEFYVDRLSARWRRQVQDIDNSERMASRVVQRTLVAAIAVDLLAALLLAPTNQMKVLLDIGAPLVITWLNLTRNYVSDAEPIRLAWRVRSRWVLPVIAVATTCLTLALATEAVNGFPMISFVTALSAVTAGLLILPTALIFFITPESRPNKAGSPPGARIRRSRGSAWRGALLIMVPIAVARAGFMATAYGWLTAVSYTLPFALACGVCFWLVCGGFPSLQYSALFTALHSSGRGPKNYLAFLDWASSQLLLRTAGSALRFSHREIQQYLSTTWRVQSRPTRATRDKSR